MKSITIVEVQEKPILMSRDMVIACLNDLKTQTRRQLKEQPIIDESWGYVYWNNHQYDIHSWKEDIIADCPYGDIGDVLRVRENIFSDKGYSAKGHKERVSHPLFTPRGKAVLFKGYMADVNPDFEIKSFKQIPCIHMPRIACRLRLEITGIRIEQINEITPQDAIMEGINYNKYLDGYHTTDGKNFHCSNPRRSFEKLWLSINGAESWDLNPWVWVISFKVISKERPNS